MKTHDDFWLALHDMANSLNSDPATPKEKAQKLLEFWQAYPQVAGKQLTTEFRMVLAIFLELEAILPRAAP